MATYADLPRAHDIFEGAFASRFALPPVQHLPYGGFFRGHGARSAFSTSEDLYCVWLAVEDAFDRADIDALEVSTTDSLLRLRLRIRHVFKQALESFFGESPVEVPDCTAVDHTAGEYEGAYAEPCDVWAELEDVIWRASRLVNSMALALYPWLGNRTKACPRGRTRSGAFYQPSMLTPPKIDRIDSMALWHALGELVEVLCEVGECLSRGDMISSDAYCHELVYMPKRAY